MKRTIMTSTVLIVLVTVLASVLVATVVLSNTESASKNNEIKSLNSQITNLTSQVSALQENLENLSRVKSANLITALGIAEVGNTSELTHPYNRLYIAGTVTNNGSGAALNAGLQVIAYNTYGRLEINMTVPIGRGEFGTSEAITSYILSNNPYSDPPKFGNLVSGGTANANLNIYHEGVVRNWTITPVWTNTP
jgi:hypothetical protein